MSHQNLKLMKFNGFETLVSSELGVAPYFSSLLRYRVHHKLACNIAVTGEPGIGKSYFAMDSARVYEGLKRNGKDRFSVNQIVYFYSDYMALLNKLRMYKAIMFDEPSYAMGKRDWYKDLNKVLVQTLESQRFLVHPLYIPIINLALLDKTIRSYLIQFQIHVVGRGHALVYRVKPSQMEEKVYRYQITELFYRMFDNDKCSRDTCLGCKKLKRQLPTGEHECSLLRAEYERKKASIQHRRYEQAQESASRKESQDLTEKQIEELIMPHVEQLKTVKGQMDVTAMRLYLRDQGIHVSSWKAYNIKKMIELQHPDLFGQ